MPSTPSSTQKETAHQKEGIVLIISSPSGTGKTTLCHRLMEKLPQLKINISHTTRSPRNNEVDGQDYFFISEKLFQTMIDSGEFLEWANFNGNLYGTAFESLNNSRASGNDVILELDVQGAEILRKLNFPGISIFILPPSIKELRSRLNNRGTESEEVVNQRIETGIKEIAACQTYDYILTNHEVEESVDNIISIFNSEKLRASRFIPESEDIQALLDCKEKI